VIYHFVTAVYTMSITLALCRMVRVDASESRVRGAVAADGFGSVVATLFGGVPLVSYDQNVGAISLTGVGSRFVFAISSVLLVVMALVPKIGLILSIVPTFVLGGTLIFMFGMIVVVGVNILGESLRSQRDLLIVAASVALSTAINFAPPAVFDVFSPSVRLWLPTASSSVRSRAYCSTWSFGKAVRRSRRAGPISRDTCWLSLHRR